jgi:tetratricopeptide (TPR) repeat protein
MASLSSGVQLIRCKRGIATWPSICRHRPRIADNPRLEELDRSLKRDPDALDSRFERAGLLREQGRFEEAKRDYLKLPRRAPSKFGA